jgi:hypothetical protein
MGRQQQRYFASRESFGKESFLDDPLKGKNKLSKTEH